MAWCGCGFFGKLKRSCCGQQNEDEVVPYSPRDSDWEAVVSGSGVAEQSGKGTGDSRQPIDDCDAVKGSSSSVDSNTLANGGNFHSAVSIPKTLHMNIKPDLGVDPCKFVAGWNDFGSERGLAPAPATFKAPSRLPYTCVKTQLGFLRYLCVDYKHDDFPPANDWSIVIAVPKTKINTYFCDLMDIMKSHNVLVFTAVGMPDAQMAELPMQVSIIDPEDKNPNVLLFVDFSWHCAHGVLPENFQSMVRKIEDFLQKNLSTHCDFVGNFTTINNCTWVRIGRNDIDSVEHESSTMPPDMEQLARFDSSNNHP